MGWRSGSRPSAARAAGGRRLLQRAQATTREVDSVRETERVTSGVRPGVVTEYRLKAPDRMAVHTDAGADTVVIGRREWVRAPGDRWQPTATAPAPFHMRSLFRWTTYARVVRALDRRRDDGRRVAELAFMEPGTPMWQRLTVDVDTGRVTEARVTLPGYYIDRRFHAFDGPMHIRPPEAHHVR